MVILSRNFYRFALPLVLFALYQSCSSSFNPSAPYKNITVVYGILSLSDSINYVKIEKAFLSESNGNAYTEAQVADSIYYPAGEITAVLEAYNNGTLVNSIPLTRADADTSGQPKQGGIFVSSPNIVYETKTPLNETYTYELVITNTKTGKTTTAQTYIVNSFYVFEPNSTSQIYFIPDTGVYYDAQWESAANAALYQLVVHFHYKEINMNNTSEYTYDTLTWTFPSFTPPGQNMITQDVPEKGFYTFLASLIPVNSSVERQALSFDFWVYAGGSAFYTYQQVSIANSTSLVYGQTNPTYTDISNGIGLFSSTNLEQMNNVGINSKMVDSIAYSPITKKLNFLNSEGVLP
jgi:hypothetical protein